VGLLDYRVEVFSKGPDGRASTLLNKIHVMGFSKVKDLELADIYTISTKLDEASLQKCGELLSNPVTQWFLVGKPFVPKNGFDFVVEIGFLPGVTDNSGNIAGETISDFFGEKASGTDVFSTQAIFLSGEISEEDAQAIGAGLANSLILRGWALSRRALNLMKCHLLKR
jgi:phosphoribosylformylglycinamidine synthase